MFSRCLRHGALIWNGVTGIGSALRRPGKSPPILQNALFSSSKHFFRVFWVFRGFLNLWKSGFLRQYINSKRSKKGYFKASKTWCFILKGGDREYFCTQECGGGQQRLHKLYEIVSTFIMRPVRIILTNHATILLKLYSCSKRMSAWMRRSSVLCTSVTEGSASSTGTQREKQVTCHATVFSTMNSKEI